MPDEPTMSTDTDDGLAINAQQRRGALLEEVSSRHLGYRRALERHAEQVQLELIEVQATAAAPDTLSQAGTLKPSYAAVREARAAYDAARAALRMADAKHSNNA